MMWKLRDYRGEKDNYYYEEEEYKALEEKLAKAEKVLYNISNIIENENIADEDVWVEIEGELKKWNAENAK